MLPVDPTAKEIAEYLLDCTGSSMLSGDFDTLAGCFALPQEIHTFDGVLVLHTREDLRRVFKNVRAYYSKEGVTDLVRHCVEAAFHNAETVHSVHEARLLAGDRLLQKPYPVFSVLKLIEGRWKVVRSEYAVTDAPALSAALSDFDVKQKR